MGFIDKYNCILCKYNKYNKNNDSCFNHRVKDASSYPIGECFSLSNILHGKVLKHFPFKQLYELYIELRWKKFDEYAENMEKKYGNYALENDDVKFIWCVKAFDDLSSSDASLFTMNDIDIIYDKKTNEYILGIETAYIFDNFEAECKYLKNCLIAFTNYMENNNLDKNKPFTLFMNSPELLITAKTIEELYTNFRIFVNGFCSL